MLAHFNKTLSSSRIYTLDFSKPKTATKSSDPLVQLSFDSIENVANVCFKVSMLATICSIWTVKLSPVSLWKAPLNSSNRDTYLCCTSLTPPPTMVAINSDSHQSRWGNSLPLLEICTRTRYQWLGSLPSTYRHELSIKIHQCKPRGFVACFTYLFSARVQVQWNEYVSAFQERGGIVIAKGKWGNDSIIGLINQHNMNSMQTNNKDEQASNIHTAMWTSPCTIAKICTPWNKTHRKATHQCNQVQR